MKTLNIKSTNHQPYINCDAEKGLIEIKGKSILANPLIDIFEPVFQWLDKYLKNYKAKTTVNIQLEYFNTSSSKCILDIFKSLQPLHHEKKDAEIEINWFYEKFDEDMLEAGQDYQELVNMPFRLRISKEE